MTILTSRQFNQDTSRAKRESEKGPVFITHRGRRSHVLMTIEEYDRISGRGESIADQLAMPGIEDIEFDPPRLMGSLVKDVDFS